MNPETAVTFTRGHFNQVFFAVYMYVLCMYFFHVIYLSIDLSIPSFQQIHAAHVEKLYLPLILNPIALSVKSNIL